MFPMFSWACSFFLFSTPMPPWWWTFSRHTILSSTAFSSQKEPSPRLLAPSFLRLPSLFLLSEPSRLDDPSLFSNSLALAALRFSLAFSVFIEQDENQYIALLLPLTLQSAIVSFLFCPITSIRKSASARYKSYKLNHWSPGVKISEFWIDDSDIQISPTSKLLYVVANVWNIARRICMLISW